MEFFSKISIFRLFSQRKLLSLLEIPPCYFYYYYQTFLHIFSTTKIGLNEPKMTLDIDYKHSVYFLLQTFCMNVLTFKVCTLIEFELTNIIVVLVFSVSPFSVISKLKEIQFFFPTYFTTFAHT